MRRLTPLLALGFASVALFGDSACGSGFGRAPSTEQIEVTFDQGGAPANSPGARLPLSFTKPVVYTVRVRALHADGTLDTSYNGYVRLSSKPGNVVDVSGNNTNGRNVLLTNGVADSIQVSLLAGYGNTQIWGDDVGYVPADPDRQCMAGAACPRWCSPNAPCAPACSNGIDDNGNGLIDYPADPGCFAANDDTEDGGTYASGVSPTIYYYVPRIADVRGGPEGGTGTPFPSEAVNVDTGYRGANDYAFNVVVTNVSSAGFFVTDIDENKPGGGGFASVYAYNFSAPPNMRQCDRLRSFGGTTSDFYGFTEVNYPTWELEEWDPTARLCGIPEPHTLAQTCSAAQPDCFTLPTQGMPSTSLLSVAAGLVRLDTYAAYMAPDPLHPGQEVAVPGSKFHVGAKLGPGFPCRKQDARAECQGPAAPAPYTFTADATNCDYNGDAKIDRTTGSPENDCATACGNGGDPECSEYSNYLAQNQFNFVVEQADASGATVAGTQVNIQGDASTDADFKPIQWKGQPLRSFTGILYFFSGGSQFTVQARCADDIVTNLAATPIPSDTACVHARTILDNTGSN